MVLFHLACVPEKLWRLGWSHKAWMKACYMSWHSNSISGTWAGWNRIAFKNFWCKIRIGPSCLHFSTPELTTFQGRMEWQWYSSVYLIMCEALSNIKSCQTLVKQQKQLVVFKKQMFLLHCNYRLLPNYHLEQRVAAKGEKIKNKKRERVEYQIR